MLKRLLFLFLACAAAMPLRSELPLIRLAAIFPPVAQAGSRTEVTIEGADLDDAREMIFSRDDVKAEPKLIPGTTNREPNRFILIVDTNAAPGICDARVAGRFGVSNPRAFQITAGPVTTASGPNNTREQATVLPGGSTAFGRVKPAAYEWFKVSVRAGGVITARCRALELDSKLEPVLTLYNPAGDEICRSANGAPIQHFAETDGDWFVRLNDVTFRGGNEYYYTLQAGAIPVIEHAEPLFSTAGETNNIRLSGWNLTGKPSSGPNMEILDVQPGSAEGTGRVSERLKPGAFSLGGIDCLVQGPAGGSDTVFIPLIPRGVLSCDCNVDFERLQLPMELSTRFNPTNDWVGKFTAQKGDVYTFEIISERLNFPTDPYLLLQKINKSPEGKETFADLREVYDLEENPGGMYFNTSSRDSALRHEFKEDGEYRIICIDLFNRGKGKQGWPFHLSIRKDAPDFHLVLFPAAPPNPNRDAKSAPVWSSFLRASDKIALDVYAFRSGNFSGEIGLEITGLPPGVTFEPKSVPSGVGKIRLVLTSGADVPTWAGEVTVVGKAQADGGEIVRAARAGTAVWPVEDYTREAVTSRLSRNFCMAVDGSDPAPVSLDWAEDKTVEIAAGAKLQLPIKIARKPGFEAPIKFRIETDPLKEFEVDGKATNAVVELDTAQVKWGAGTHLLNLLGQTTGKYLRINPAEARQAAEQLKQLTELDAALGKEIADLTEAKKKPDANAVEIEEKIKGASAKKESTAAQVKSLQAKLQTADVNFTVYATPVVVVVK